MSPTLEPIRSEEPITAPIELPTQAPSAAGGAIETMPTTGSGASSGNAGLTFGLIGLVVVGASALVLGLRKRTT